MKRSKIIQYICALTLLIAGCVAVSAQQTDPSQSYSVSLHVIIGSDEPGAKNDIPKDFAQLASALKNQFGFANYRLASTFMGRLANSGSFSYKSASNVFGKETTATSQTFLEWNISNFKLVPNTSGPRAFVSDGFNFGARIPVTTFVAAGDKSTPITNYEPIGLNLRTVGLKENVPTMIGTLNLPGTSGTMFLIMTVHSAD